MTPRGVSGEVHPGAWWVWALGLALLASRTTNVLVLAMLIAVTAYVAVSCRRPTPWSKAYALFLRLALLAVVLRVGLTALAGHPDGTHVLVQLPRVRLPHWMQGIRLGGPVTAEQVLGSVERGMSLVGMLACLGAANVVTTPSRLVKALPAALYEAGLAVTVAVSIAPQTVVQLQRVRAARRLRGRPTRGLAGLRGIAVPVLEGALESSLALAAAMDSRGYGRRVAVPATRRVLAAGASLAGLVGVGAGVYVVSGSGPRWLGWPALSLGAALLAVGLVAGGARTPRTRYRADRWDARGWLLAGLGVLAVGVTVASGNDPLLQPSDPLSVPGLPWAPATVVLLGVLPAWVAPAPRPARAAAAPSPLSERLA